MSTWTVPAVVVRIVDGDTLILDLALAGFEPVPTKIESSLPDHSRQGAAPPSCTTREEINMATDLDRDELRRIRDLAETLVEEHGWALMDMDLRNILGDHGLSRSDRAERELSDRAVWLLS